MELTDSAKKLNLLLSMASVRLAGLMQDQRIREMLQLKPRQM